jgi:leader peptidase (prepilin peptidase) / N-methyltransferase
MSDMPFIEILFFVLGAIVGSFLNVCIVRIPRDESIVRPGSKCPGCGTHIRFYDNIPIVSYLILRGKCRKCGQRISIRYAAVELLTAVLFAALFWLFGPSFELAVALVFTCLLIVISFIDLEFLIIPDILSIGGIVLGLVLSFVRTPPFFDQSLSIAFGSLPGFLQSLLGIVIGGGILYAIAKLYEIVRKAEGMGGGDIKLLAMIGAFCGITGVVFALVAGSIIGSVVGIPVMLIKGKDAKYAIPFGPFLSLGALLYTMVGDGLIDSALALLTRQ